MNDSQSGTAAKMTKDIQDTATNVREKVGNIRDRARDSVTGVMDQSATTVESVSDRISDVADAAVERIQDSADYVRQTDLRTMGVNLKYFVRRYPTASVVLGALVGFLVVRSLSDTSATT